MLLLNAGSAPGYPSEIVQYPEEEKSLGGGSGQCQADSASDISRRAAVEGEPHTDADDPDVLGTGLAGNAAAAALQFLRTVYTVTCCSMSVQLAC